ncbi:tape measure protein, partial [Cetobacterium sp.]|uniref:tape measure protein n=1 Tax=Cetobacterium sp. TaxID=2071632 RepID=UPI003F3BA037
MANTLGTLLIDVKADTQQLIQGFNKAEIAIDKTTKQMSYAVKGLIGAFVGLNTLDIAKNFTTQLDKITSANNKLKLVTKTTEEFTNAQKRLFEVAQITSQGYSETVSLYSKLSDSMLNMGKSQSDIFRTVETVNKAIALSGSSAEEASAAILQLGQAFGSGLLQGDELKSINENAQGLSKAIAEGMGVAVGELKQLGADGKITSEILAKALEKVAGSVDSNYSKMEKTIAQSSINISNSIQKIISDFDKMSGVSKSVASVFNDISKYLESINGEDIQAIADTAETIGKVALSAGVLAVGVKAYNTAVQIATAYNALFAGSYGAVNSAIVLATASQVAFNKAMKLSALGIAVTAIYGLSESFIEAKKRSDNLSLSVEELANNFDALELKARLVDVNKELKKMDENIKGYNDTQKMMYQGGYDLAYKEKIQLEKSIALIDKKNEALKSGNSTSSQQKKPSELTDELKAILNPQELVIQKYAKLFQDLTAAEKMTAENAAKIQKQMNEEIANLDKDAVEKRKEAEREKEKAVKDAQDRIKDLTKEATELATNEVDKINAKYMEMYEVIKNTFNPEQLNAFNASWQESVDKANGTLDKQKEKQDLINQALAVATNEIDTINNKYLEMFEAIKDNPLFDDEKMTEFYKKWQDEIDKTKEKLDFSNTIELDIVGDDKSVQRITKSFDELQKATKKYEDNRAKIKKGSEEEAQNEEMFRKDQMNGYINMTGAIGSMFEQGSKEAADFQVAQTSLALVEGTRAILTAGTGDPYTAIPRMIAMGAMVSSLLGNIGVSFGMNKTSESTTSDSMSSLKANDGVGTVLGDTTKQSESIAKAMGIL